MPISAAEFAVGDRAQADLFLASDDLGDLGVFDLASSAAVIAPAARCARASLSGAVRRIEPT